MSENQQAFGGARVIYSARIEKESAQQDHLFGDEIPHPYNEVYGDAIEYYSQLSGINAWHSRCVRLKSDCAVNLGIDVVAGDETAAMDALEIVNDRGQSFGEVISRMALDFEATGNGYLEVVRDRSGRVAELYHCPSALVWLRPRGSETPFYYRNQGGPVPFPAFRRGAKDTNSLLHFANYTHDDLYYGLPDWRGCVSDIQLAYYANLYNQKFFINSGVPDLAIITEGGQFDEDTEQAVVSFFQNQFRGVANAHRTLYLPIAGSGVSVRFEKLTTEMKDRDMSFEKLSAQTRDSIVGAHGVPPRMVGVVVGGALGGSGEVTGQLKIFQEVTIGPRQFFFELKLNPVIRDMGFPDAEIKFASLDTSVTEAPSQYYPGMVSAGILTVDEARAEIGYRPMDDIDTGDAPQLQVVRQLEKIRKSLDVD